MAGSEGAVAGAWITIDERGSGAGRKHTTGRRGFKAGGKDRLLGTQEGASGNVATLVAHDITQLDELRFKLTRIGIDELQCEDGWACIGAKLHPAVGADDDAGAFLFGPNLANGTQAHTLDAVC